jgi:threonylcarbamoyladenosine tRNA methylthiotransferase MtaB
MPSQVTPDVKRERTRVLRGLSDRKNLEFRRSMIGKSLSAITLEQRGVALTSNFLKVQLATDREPNQLVDLEVDGLSSAGLRERALLPVLQ